MGKAEYTIIGYETFIMIIHIFNMSLLSNIFYILSIPFIGVEIYQMINRNNVFRKFDQNQESESLFHYFTFYLFKVIYLIWIPIGLFTHFWPYFLILISLGLFKFLVLLIKRNILINLYDIINVILSILILLIIFFQALFQ